MLALQAFDADVSAKTDHLPFVVAAGVFFLQTDSIADFYIHGFGFRLEIKSGDGFPDAVDLLSQVGGRLARRLSIIFPHRGIKNLP